MWVARDSNMDLWWYLEKPQKGMDEWKQRFGDRTNPVKLPSSFLPEVKWTDEEPTEVELTIK